MINLIFKRVNFKHFISTKLTETVLSFSPKGFIRLAEGFNPALKERPSEKFSLYLTNNLLLVFSLKIS